MKKIKKIDINKEKKDKIIKSILIAIFCITLLLIHLVSPKITEAIQNMAKYIAEIDSNYITRIVELILGASIALSVVINKK